MKFFAAEKKLQTAWKLTAKGLPRAARKPGLYRNNMYPFCLPLEYAGYNLFQDIRDDALATFNKHNIVWHSSALPGLPSNHLCSSQVFAVNLLFPFMDKPEALAEALQPFFPEIDHMVPVEDGRFISFEWIGKINYLNENPKIGEYRLRGAGNTSIDAMVAYETSNKERVMLLIEMKYSESYGVSYKRFRSDGTDRFENYEDLFYGEASPINLTIAPNLEDFLYEPFYQLLRHSLLASQIMVVGKPRVSRVQVVHLTVHRNKELLAVTSPKFRQHGDTTYEVWNKLLKDPQDFTLIPVETFFKNPLLANYRELELWSMYMKNRYSFLR
ncbi:hypothetical protein AGMMS49991_06730 [Spirochaetia bacterium]|nr:hypothetical protein AGMMS49991_06730 [Spirochaetia bacterium]